MTRGRSQRWVLDTLLGTGGWEVLHPEAQGFFEELVYNHADAARVFGQVKSGAMFPKACLAHCCSEYRHPGARQVAPRAAGDPKVTRARRTPWL